MLFPTLSRVVPRASRIHTPVTGFGIKDSAIDEVKTDNLFRTNLRRSRLVEFELQAV